MYKSDYTTLIEAAERKANAALSEAKDKQSMALIHWSNMYDLLNQCKQLDIQSEEFGGTPDQRNTEDGPVTYADKHG